MERLTIKDILIAACEFFGAAACGGAVIILGMFIVSIIK